MLGGAKGKQFHCHYSHYPSLLSSRMFVQEILHELTSCEGDGTAPKEDEDELDKIPKLKLNYTSLFFPYKAAVQCALHFFTNHTNGLMLSLNKNEK